MTNFILLIAVSAFAATMSGVKLKAGRYSNGACTAAIDVGPDGTPAIRLVTQPNSDQTQQCQTNSASDCGNLQLPLEVGVRPDGQLVDRSVYRRKIVQKSVEKKADGAIGATFEAKEHAMGLRLTYHTELSVTINPAGELTQVSGFWAYADGLIEGVKTRNRIHGRCNGLKPVSDAAAPGTASPTDGAPAGR